MPRANRHFLPGYVWHITHRCHRKDFLLKFEAGGMYALREEKVKLMGPILPAKVRR